MPTIRNDEVEAEARALLREQIERSPWFREGLTEEERQSRIQLEVDACGISRLRKRRTGS